MLSLSDEVIDILHVRLELLVWSYAHWSLSVLWLSLMVAAAWKNLCVITPISPQIWVQWLMSILEILHPHWIRLKKEDG